MGSLLSNCTVYLPWVRLHQCTGAVVPGCDSVTLKRALRGHIVTDLCVWVGVMDWSRLTGQQLGLAICMNHVYLVSWIHGLKDMGRPGGMWQHLSDNEVDDIRWGGRQFWMGVAWCQQPCYNRLYQGGARKGARIIIALKGARTIPPG
jgi:hypothetical protein